MGQCTTTQCVARVKDSQTSAARRNTKKMVRWKDLTLHLLINETLDVHSQEAVCVLVCVCRCNYLVVL